MPGTECGYPSGAGKEGRNTRMMTSNASVGSRTGGALGTLASATEAWSDPENAHQDESEATESPIEATAAAARTVSICDTQPVTAEGIRTLLGGNPELQFLE